MKKYPFKFLDSYNLDDTDIFFGREEETEALYAMVFQNSMLLIYGASGTGKTSLIQCGLAGKFKSYDWLPIIIRRGNNINASLEKQLAEAGGNDVDDDDIITKDPSKKITGLLRLIKGVYLNNFKPIYLIFDQFEELYVLGTKVEQQQFVESVKEILRAEQPVKMIFSIREEYLGYLNEFEKEVPQLLHKKLRIEPMALDKVTDVIKGINNYSLSNVKIKTDEIDAISQGIFDRIKGKKKTLTIDLPYLQVFLDKLYLETTGDESRQADALITMNVLNRIGDIGDVLRNFLEEQVKSISTKLGVNYKNITTEVIWKILSPFSTLEGTKEPISKKALAERLSDLDNKLIDESVESFVNSRILNFSENENLYELAHDSLALRIAEKRSDEEIAILEVQRLIKSQLAIKEEAREYFTERQLLFIEPYLEKFKASDEEKDWIAKSHGYREEEKKNQQDQLVKLQEAKATKKRLRIVITLLGLAVIATAAAVFFAFNATQQKKRLEEQRQKAVTALAQTQKLINAFYFYKDRFALAFKDDKFYFIDKNGDKVEKLGEWEKADQFGSDGFARVKTTENYLLTDFIIDTLGNTFKVAYDPKLIDSSTRAVYLPENILQELPPEIFKSKQLQILVLNGNVLATLPSEIGELTNLKVLELSNNQLTSLPNEIGQLKNLTTLHLMNNQLTGLPPEIGELKNLTELDLINNRLNTLPKEIVQLNNLRSLSLTGNLLTSLPQEIGELKNLTALGLSNNQLTGLPEQIGKLTNLTALGLINNRLTSLPGQIGQLTHLTALSIANNQIISLPVEVGQLSDLTVLSLSGNPLTSLPKEIWDFKNLTQFTLTGNHLTGLPKEIWGFRNLTILGLRGFKLTNVPTEILALTNLTDLDLGNNNLSGLPKEIGALTNLTRLDLDSNQLSGLPGEIGELTNLTILDLRKNNLGSLPKEIGRLKNLKTLYLMNNQLEVLPKEIGELQNLKKPELSVKTDTNAMQKNPSIQQLSLSVGSNYEGGIVLSIDDDGKHGLIVARSDQSDAPTSWNNAKNLCDSYVSDGFSKWRLPTIDELKMIYKNLDLIDGLNTRGLYWSSGIDANGYTSLINFGNGYTNYKFNTAMGHSFYVRAVRDFNR
jgi:Leucine-rich repeat (LRR) protein